MNDRKDMIKLQKENAKSCENMEYETTLIKRKSSGNPGSKEEKKLKVVVDKNDDVEKSSLYSSQSSDGSIIPETQESSNNLSLNDFNDDF